MNKKLLDTIVIILITISVTAVVFMFLENKEKSNNTQNETQNKEPLYNIKTTYECKNSPVLNAIDYETDNVSLETFNNYKSSFTLLFKDGDYEIYKDNCSSDNSIDDICKYTSKDENKKYDAYYGLNTKTNTFYNTIAESKNPNSNNYYKLVNSNDENSSDYNLPLVNIKDKIVIDGYYNLSCSFHSDIQFDTCNKSDTILAINADEKEGTYGKSTKYGLVSLKDKSKILDINYDYVSEDENGNFLVEKYNKMGLYSSTGEVLLNLDYDYIGYNEYFGYITIKGEDVKIYDNNINLMNISEREFRNIYTKILNETNECNKTKENSEKVNNLYLTNPDSNLWSSGSILTIQDITDPYYDDDAEKEEDNYRFKYIGKSYTGDKIIIYSMFKGCYSQPLMYVIDNNKAYKIDPKEIDIKKDEDGNNAAFCF